MFSSFHARKSVSDVLCGFGGVAIVVEAFAILEDATLAASVLGSFTKDIPVSVGMDMRSTHHLGGICGRSQCLSCGTVRLDVVADIAECVVRQKLAVRQNLGSLLALT